jgi:hypothetical protein
VLSSNASQLSPELQYCEECLACVIEGMGKEQLLVRFLGLDKSDSGKESSFVIDVSGSSYKSTSSLLLSTGTHPANSRYIVPASEHTTYFGRRSQ